jgi:hypothetical protein
MTTIQKPEMTGFSHRFSGRPLFAYKIKNGQVKEESVSWPEALAKAQREREEILKLEAKK